MSNGASRRKGYVGESQVRLILGKDFKRTGFAGVANSPDLTSSWACVSCKNKAVPISLKQALAELVALEAQAPDKEHYVAVKVNHIWLVIQKLEQLRDYRC